MSLITVYVYVLGKAKKADCQTSENGQKNVQKHIFMIIKINQKLQFEYFNIFSLLS